MVAEVPDDPALSSLLNTSFPLSPNQIQSHQHN